MDDTIITKVDAGDYVVVSNAGCADKISQHLDEHAKLHDGVRVERIQQALVAIQGPNAVQLLQRHVSDGSNLEDLKFMRTAFIDFHAAKRCRVSRCGYTGEDGFEIAVPSDQATSFVDDFLTRAGDQAILVGLGARDTLRLEAGLCLYGNDIDETTTPSEASLLWTISKRRRREGKFPGAEIILDQIRKPGSVQRKRVGFIAGAGPPVRAGTEILSASQSNEVTADSYKIGIATSGCPSPCLGKSIGMGYVTREHAKIGHELAFKFCLLPYNSPIRFSLD